MLDVLQFYISLLGDLVSKIWGSFHITSNVTYMHLFIAVLITIAFIKLLQLRFESNGLNAIKRYKRKREDKS